MFVAHSASIRLGADSRSLVWLFGTILLASCGSDTPARPPEKPGVALAIRVDRVALEPLTSAAARVDALDADGRIVARNVTAFWTSSDTSVLAIDERSADAGIAARRPGSATITARVDGLSATAPVTVAWNPGRRLFVPIPPDLVVGDGRRLVATANQVVPVDRVTWNSSDPAVAQVEPSGWLVATRVGTTTVSASFAGLSTSFAVTVRPQVSGFAYFYSDPTESDVKSYLYDILNWAPAPTEAYSTLGTVSAKIVLPYGALPDFAWVGQNRLVPEVALYAASLDGSRCTATIHPSWSFAQDGAPAVSCENPDREPLYQGSAWFEALAFRPGEFDGAVTVVRPGMNATSTARGGVTETATNGARTFELPGVQSDSVFWFVTPDGPRFSMCGTSRPERATPATIVVHCSAPGVSEVRNFHAIGFGADVRHGAAPIGFVELDAHGAIKRKAVSGLTIESVDANDLGDVNIVVSGATLASFNRVPAVLITPVADSSALCYLIQPSRPTDARVSFRIRCDAAARGVTVGVIY